MAPAESCFEAEWERALSEPREIRRSGVVGMGPVGGLGRDIAWDQVCSEARMVVVENSVESKGRRAAQKVSL